MLIESEKRKHVYPIVVLLIVFLCLVLIVAVIMCLNTDDVMAGTIYDSGTIKADDGKVNIQNPGICRLRFRAKKDGSINFYFKSKEQGRFDVVLYGVNPHQQLSKKDNLEVLHIDPDNTYTAEIEYPIKKRKLYELRIKNKDSLYEYTVNTSLDDWYTIGGKTKKKARNIKRKQKYDGLMRVGGDSQWFKFKVKKKKKVTVRLTFGGEHTIYYKLFAKGEKTFKRKSSDNEEGFHKMYISGLKKGTTVYLRVYMKNQKDGGYFYYDWQYGNTYDDQA